MLRTNQPFAYGFFQNAPSAVAAVQALLNPGFASEHVGVLMLDGSPEDQVERANCALEDAGAASTSLSTRSEAETALLAQRGER